VGLPEGGADSFALGTRVGWSEGPTLGSYEVLSRAEESEVQWAGLRALM
jgi:hypothetical protein